MTIDGHFDGIGKESIKGGQCTYIFVQLPALIIDWCDVARVTIDMLPDVALLEVFVFYLDEIPEAWPRLVHVCRTWRNVAFGSPRRLGLRLNCRASTPVRETLDIWPLLPIAIETNPYDRWSDKWGVDNIVAALEHSDRICQLELTLCPNSQFEKVLAVMQQPFPALASLGLGPEDKKAPLVSIPASFLGGSSPQLRTLHLDQIPFPGQGLLKLLLSATHLVNLSLHGISRSSYISPEAMLNCLSLLTGLKSLSIGFKSSRSFPRQRSQFLPPSTRILLPVLSSLWFEGVTNYLEDLMAWIDAPLLDKLDVTFFNQIFDTPQLTQLISRSPKFKAYNHAQLFFSESETWLILSQAFNRGAQLKITFSSQPDEQISTLVLICTASFPRALIATAEHLYVLVSGDWEEDIENDRWLELLHLFTGAKALYISLEFTLSLPLALLELTWEEETEVLPALETIFLEDNVLFPQPPGVQDVIGQIVAVRELTCHPITVSPWDIVDEMEED